MCSKMFLTFLIICCSGPAVYHCLTVTEQPIKVCQNSTCVVSDPSLQKQTYNFSTVANSEIHRRSFNYTEDAVVTTGQVNNRIVFECSADDPIDNALLSTVKPQLSKTVEYINKFSSSCREVLEKNPSADSGYYNLRLKNGTFLSVYCDMVGVDCEDLGGWTRIGYFNMTEPGSDSCPSPLVSRDYTELTHSLCQRQSFYSGCDSFYYDNLGIEYESVCGRALGYQYGSPDALGWSWADIDSTYVDGLSITYDSPRKHIWTFAGGVEPHGQNFYNCPCNIGSSAQTPSFIDGNYYCESGNQPNIGWAIKLYSTDKLWDGKQCESVEAGCCNNKGMPWFSRLLSPSTTSKVELRLCDDEQESNERVPLEMVEIFIR